MITRNPVRQVTLTVLMALASLSPLSVAQAADEERRVLRDRDVDTSVDMREEYAAAAEAKRLESINRLKELLQQGAEGDTKAEMMLRLADLYFQQGRYLYLKEMAAFDKVYDACFNNEGCNPETLKADNAQSRGWQLQSIKLYENIIQNFPRYARADQATFYLGSALQDTEQREAAVEQFKNLVRLYPSSDFVPDAYVLIGEFYFDTNNAYAALKAYQKATQFPNSPKYAFAMYKLAWCYYNVGDYNAAIQTMQKVVETSMADTSGKGLTLQDEALKDLVRFFADADQMDEAIAYFTKLGKKDLIKTMLMRLAQTYFEQGKFDKAVDTYQRLILEDPNGADCPEYQAEIIKAYRKTGNREKILAEVEKLLGTYGKTSSWARANASNPTALKKAEDTSEGELRRTAADFHNQAKSLEKGRHSDAGQVYDLARQAYATYLREFPGNSHAYDVHYAYGELLYKLKDYKGAYDEYMAVVKIDPQGKHSKFCAESAIFSAEEQVKLEGGGDSSGKKTADARKNVEAQPLTEWETRLVAACKQYADLYPGDPKVRNAVYKSAYLLYNRYRFEEAAAQFNSIIKSEPGSKEAQLAAELILDSFVVRNDFANLKTNAKFYYDLPGLGNQKFKEDTFNVYQRASFKVIETDLEKTGDKAKAADQFVAFYQEFPNADTAAQALNNASIYYYDTNQVAKAMEVRLILIDDPKFGSKTKYYYDQVAALGFDYEQIADFTRAADTYERLWGIYPTELKAKEKEPEEVKAKMTEKAGDAIYSAAVFRNAMGKWEKAVENYNAFLASFPDDQRALDVKLTIGGVYEDQKRWADAANVFKAFFEKPTPDTPVEFDYFARLHYGQALLAQGKTADATKHYQKTVEVYKDATKKGLAPGAHTEFVAEMMYMLAQPQLETYMSARIAGKAGAGRAAEDRAMADSLKKKATSLQAVEATFREIVDTGAGEWGLAGLVALGKAYENMGTSLLTSDIPSYLTEDQREIYTMTLQDRAYQQEEKAILAYKLALEKSYELTLYNENTEFATQRLGALRPDDFPGLHETIPEPRFTSSKVKTFDFETSL